MTNTNPSNSRTPKFRVGVEGSTPGLLQNLSTQFGFDITKLGNANPQDAHELRHYANSMKIQLDVAKSLLESIKTITECTVEIEKLRKEAIEASLKRKEEIEKMVSQLEVTVERHHQTLSKLAQDTQHGIQLARRKGKLDLTSGKNKFKLELAAMRKKAVAQMRVDRTVSRQKVNDDINRIKEQPEEARLLSEERREFTDYINGRTVKPRKGSPMTALFN
jgi:DNA primase catalytic subunit